MRVAGKMKVFPGCFAEYRRRHDELWPEMADELRRHGYHNYSIYLDESTGDLFYYLEADGRAGVDAMAQTDICRRWWHYMKDIMETNEDESPKGAEFTEVFHLS